jgi:hypothetical protein
MDLWSEVKKLEGVTLRTLDHGKRFEVLAVTRQNVVVKLSATLKERPIQWAEIQGAYRELCALGRVTRNRIEEAHSPRNPVYVAAILAQFPDVKCKIRPIILFISKGNEDRK